MKNIYRILIIASILVLSYFIITSLPMIFEKGALPFENLNSVFGNLIVVTIFIAHNLSKNKDLEYKIIYKSILRSLIIVSVIFYGVLFYSLMKYGILNGENLFWQINAILFGLISFVFIQYNQQKLFGNNNNVA